jgi:hypothetical protein
MFIFRSTSDLSTHKTNDIKDLQDIVLGVTNDESEAERFATVAGHMKFSDIFCSNNGVLTCLRD